MLNKTKKCNSKCVNLPIEKCYKGCIFTDHCRLSSKYKINPINCKIMKRTKKILTKSPSTKVNNLKHNDITNYTPNSFIIPKKENKDTMSYSPEINKLLVQSRYSEKYDIFNSITSCMNIDVDKYELKDSILKYYINPRVKLKNGECVSYWNNEAQQMFLDNLSKHNIINIESLIVPKQSYYNCWFNTGFMMNYISDKGRKFNKYFRQFMITGKMKGFKPFLNKLKGPLFLFNIAIESTLQGNSLAKIMNTNDIIEKIHENIPKEYKKNIMYKNESGNPYIYQIALLNYISNNPYLYNLINGYKLYLIIKQNGYFTKINDIVWAELLEYQSNIIDTKDVYIKDHLKNKYMLDSILVRDTKKTHFCCLLTINKEEYIYDGASNPQLKILKWKNNIFLNQDKNFYINPNSLVWNMRNSYQVLNYYRV